MAFEHWRQVVDVPSYEVSSFGRVRRSVGGKSTYPGKVLSERTRKDGYVPVVLSLGKRGKSKQTMAHILVAEAFLGPKPSPNHEVAHLDGDPTNSRVENLRWATHKENMTDMVDHGRSTRGEKHHQAKLTEDKVREIRCAWKSGKGKSLAPLAKALEVNYSCAYEAAVGKTWNHLK